MAALQASHPCGFCTERNRWPSACPGDPVDDFCLGEIDHRHEMGDHRRCGQACDGFAMLAEVAVRGSDCARAAGLTYAVVNTLTTPWELRAFARLQQAKPYRSSVGKAALGRKAFSIEFKSQVFVVHADGTVL